jgi:predicted NBD/HSP70 family sugar kinase
VAGEITGGDLSRLRQLNLAAALRAMRTGGPATLTELAGRTGLSRAAVEDVVRELVEQGWVEEVPPVAGVMGRPARRYRFRAGTGHVLGVDIGAHRIRATVTDLDGEVRGREQRTVGVSAGRERRLAVADEVAAACVRGAGLKAEQLRAVGVATTGLVDAAGMVLLSVAIPEWTGVRLAEHFAATYTCPVLVDNDSRLGALAERWLGVAKYAQDMIYLLAGLRTGLGLVIDGRLHRGFSGAAGETGALPEMRWIRAQDHLAAWRSDATDDAGRLFAAARGGDRSAQAAVRRYVKDLALGTAMLVLTLDPQVVVLGGGFSRSADLLIDPLRAELDRQCIRTPEVLASSLGEEAVVLGAVRLALDHVDAVVFAPPR